MTALEGREETIFESSCVLPCSDPVVLRRTVNVVEAVFNSMVGNSYVSKSVPVSFSEEFHW